MKPRALTISIHPEAKCALLLGAVGEREPAGAALKQHVLQLRWLQIEKLPQTAGAAPLPSIAALVANRKAPGCGTRESETRGRSRLANRSAWARRRTA